MASPTYSFFTIDDTAAGTHPNELLGINDAGELTGYYGSGPSDPERGYFVTSLVPVTDFAAPTVPTGAQSQVAGINNLGAAVGSITDSTGATTAQKVSQSGGFSQVNGPSGSSGDDTYLLGINDLGSVAGYYVDSTGKQVAWAQLSGGKAAALDLGKNVAGRATGINDANVIVGVATVHGATEGFIDDTVSNTLVFLTGPAGAVATQALGINNQGQVVGDYVDASGNTHGFIYTMGAGTVPGTYSGPIDDPNAQAFGGHTTTVIDGINDQGDLAGYYVDSSGATHGLLASLGALQSVNNPASNTVLSVVPGSPGAVAGGSNNVTLFDPGVGHAILYGNAGADTIVALGNADTVVGSAGGGAIFTGAGSGEVFLSAGNTTVVTGGAATVVANAAGGEDTISAAAGTLAFASGAPGSQMEFAPAAQNGSVTLVGGAGSVTGFGGGTGSLLFAGPGAATMVGGAGFATIVGGGGADQLFDGAGGAAIFAQSGPATIVATAANSTVVAGGGNAVINIDGSGGQAVFLSGAGSNVVNVAASASSGNAAPVAVVASGSSGANTIVLGAAPAEIYAGSGPTDMILGGGGGSLIAGSGPDTFGITQGVGGSDTIVGFNVALDHVALTGFAPGEVKSDLASARMNGGSEKITLTGGTTLEFFGVTHLTAASFT